MDLPLTTPPTHTFRASSRTSTVRIMGALQVPMAPPPVVARHAPAPAPVDRTEPLPGLVAAQHVHPAGKYRSTVRLRVAS